MTQLLSLVFPSSPRRVFDINDGVALNPLMVLSICFMIVVFGGIVIAVDPPDLSSATVNGSDPLSVKPKRLR